MDYYLKEGQIGTYKGKLVYMIKYKDFKPAEAKSDNVFGVKMKNGTICLVYQGLRIGEMSRYGEVYPYEDKMKMPFIFYEEAVSEKEKEGIDYKKYTKPVDDFFKHLKDWWKDLDV